MKIKFVYELESGYGSLLSLLTSKGFVNALSQAEIPDGYSLITDGRNWNIIKA